MTNGAFRALELPAGTNEIVMEYRPPLLWWYLAFSGGLALAALVVALKPAGAARWEIRPKLKPIHRN
ncbi:MAG TPA: hypothetical protein VKV17_22530 [Bryobacteraceae bacterium]|nr:hypothetical protein [Bryobacteraceae bacterium]